MTPTSGQTPLARAWPPLALYGLPAIALAILAIFVARKFLLAGVAPGDLGDARFNLYVLEHTFQWLRGDVPSYVSPQIFYPFPGSLFFSDSHAGTAFVYALFRAAGISKFSSFTLWAAVGYAATFVAAYWTLLRFGFAPLSATVGAVIFAFSLPSLAQIGHAQLIYRFGVPLAVLCLWRLLETGRLRHMLWLVIWTGWQILATVYIGIFLLIVLAAVAVFFVVVNGVPRAQIATLRTDAGALLRPFSGARFASLVVALTLAMVATVATAALLYGYQAWGARYGLGRGWAEIASMVPQPASYFIMDALPYWSAIYRAVIGVEVPMRHEHNMFMGVGASCLFIVGVAAVAAGTVAPRLRRLALVMLLTLAAVVALTTMIGDLTLYAALATLPGLNSIRGVTRIVLVTMFPVAIVIAAGMTGLMESRPRLPALAVLGVFLAMAAADLHMTQLSAFKVIDSEVRTDAIVADARHKADGTANPVLFVREGSEQPYMSHLDAMLAAQELRWPTVNGYSGNAPPGYEYELSCDSPARLLAGYESWRTRYPAAPAMQGKDVLSRIVHVGWPDCSFSRGANEASLGPSPDAADAARLTLTPLALDTRGANVSFTVGIANGGHRPVHVNSFAPVRLSWRFVPVGANARPIGWDARLQLTRDIAPNARLDVAASAALPAAPGVYHLEVSMVAELAFWFHDKGMTILRFPQVVTVVP